MSSESPTRVQYPSPFDQLVLELCRAASRELCILSPQLDYEVFDNEELVAALGALVRSTRQTRVRILVSDTRSLVTRGHRLLNLSRRLPSAISLHRLGDHPDYSRQTIVIRDSSGTLFKPGDSEHEGFYAPASRAFTGRYLELFENLWQHSEQDPELRSLSL